MIKKALLASAISFGFSGFAQAEFIQGDWLIEGDKQSTLDTRTGKEWLNLDNTEGMSLADVTQALDGELAGWRIAGLDEVLDLAYSQAEIAGISNYFWDATTIESAKNPEENTSFNYMVQHSGFARDFGLAFGGMTSSFYGTYGLFVNDYKNEVDNFFSQYTTGRNNGMRLMKESEKNYTQGIASYGWWLVSDGGVSLSSINNPEINANNPDAPVNAVSTPLSLGVFAFAAMGLAGLRRKQK